MAIKADIKRIIKEGKKEDAARLIIKARSAAMGQEGYISSENLSNCKDPNILMVVSTWQSEDKWLKWKDSDVRKLIEAEFAEVSSAPAEYDTYYMGFKL